MDFGPEDVCGGPLFCPPVTSARVQSRFEFVELGGDMCSKGHSRHWEYRLVSPDTKHIYMYYMYEYIVHVEVCRGTGPPVTYV